MNSGRGRTRFALVTAIEDSRSGQPGAETQAQGTHSTGFRPRRRSRGRQAALRSDYSRCPHPGGGQGKGFHLSTINRESLNRASGRPPGEAGADQTSWENFSQFEAPGLLRPGPRQHARTDRSSTAPSPCGDKLGHGRETVRLKILTEPAREDSTTAAGQEKLVSGSIKFESR